RRFRRVQYDGQSGRARHEQDIHDEVGFSLEYLLVQKQKRAEGLILSGGCDMFFNREMSEKFGDFFLAHLVWMAFTMIENIPANPIDVRLLGADRVMSHPQMPANAIEQLGRGSHGDGGRHTADGVKIVVPWQAERLPYNSEYRESGSDYAGAPLVMSPKIISSATRPPMATARLANNS